MPFKYPTFISLSPNIEKDDIKLALKLIFQPWKWKKGPAIALLEEKFRSFLGVQYAFAFNSGRSAFLAILNALDLEKGDEVLLQAFTCNAAVNPIIWSGLKPVYIDIEKETLNIDPQDLERKISPRAKAVMVQHTFGLPAKIGEILEICQRHNLILIEDCAHSLGATYKGKKVGTYGRAAFFSLGRDKIISSVYGGIAVTNDEALAKKIKAFQEKYSTPSYCWILQQLLHPVLTKLLVMPLYGFFGLGKFVLVGLQKLKIISKAVHKKEKQGKQPRYLPQRLPNALALLAINQFKKLERFNQRRQRIAEIYSNGLPCAQVSIETGADIERVYMRYPILIAKYNTDKILKFFRKRRIFLNDGWRKSAVVPIDTNQKRMEYARGSCPAAEEVADLIVNLPTHINISPKTAKRIRNFIREFL